MKRDLEKVGTRTESEASRKRPAAGKKFVSEIFDNKEKGRESVGKTKKMRVCHCRKNRRRPKKPSRSKEHTQV